MSALPHPLPLDLPPGDPAGLADVVSAVTGAAFGLGVLAAHLAGPAASAPGWLGADASAAGEQVGAVAALTVRAHEAVTAAVDRLAVHHDLLLDCRARVLALRAAQEEDFAVAAARLGAAPAGGLGAVQPLVLEDLLAAEAARARAHAAVLAEAADDAAATAGVLARATVVVGGTGRRGDADRVLAHLAVRLPGWGEGELAARGRELAAELSGDVRPEAWERLARDAAAFAGTPAFAAAVLTALGAGGVRDLLSFLGAGVLDPAGEVARLLTRVLGAAEPVGGAVDPVGDVLAAGLVGPSPSRDSDLVALGMGVVLAVSAAAPSRGLRRGTVVAWTRQILARESVAGRPTSRPSLDAFDAIAADPVPYVLGLLADDGDPGGAAALLGDPRAWEALLARDWADGGAAFAQVVELAAAHTGALGEGAARSGLEALGAGLGDGDPADWTVHRRTAAAVAAGLAGAVAAHVSVVTEALQLGAAGPRCTGGDLLRGLGYLTVDREVAGRVDEALRSWVQVQPIGLAGSSPVAPLPAVAVSSGYLAVQEYGQRLAYALHGFEEQAAAERRAFWWNVTVGLVVQAVPGPAGVVGQVAEPFAARWLDLDGSWHNGTDTGLRFDREDAARGVLTALPPAEAAAAEPIARQARASFDRIARALGLPEPPVPPETHWWDPFLEALGDPSDARRRWPARGAGVAHGATG